MCNIEKLSQDTPRPKYPNFSNLHSGYKGSMFLRVARMNRLSSTWIFLLNDFQFFLTLCLPDSDQEYLWHSKPVA